MYISAFIVCTALHAFTCQLLSNDETVSPTLELCLKEVEEDRPFIEGQGFIIVQEGCIIIPGEKV